MDGRVDRGGLAGTSHWFAIAIAAAATLAACRGQPPPVSTPDRIALALDAGASSVISATPIVTPALDAGSMPPAPRAESGGCRTNAECGRGRVCGRCGDGPGECVAGCSTSADC